MFNRFVKHFLFIPFLGLIFIACPNTEPELDLGDSVPKSSDEKSTSEKTPEVKKEPLTWEDAYDVVVKALHAPYDSGDYFFKILPNKVQADVTQQGSESNKVGDNTTNLGIGTYTVKVSADEIAQVDGLNCGKGRSITYTYTDYSPNGSDIIINGTLDQTRVSTPAGVVPGKSQLDICPGENTLTITGNFDATLKIKLSTHAGITSERYDGTYIYGNRGVMLFAEHGNPVFTYNGETKKLDDTKTRQLLKVK